MAEKVKNNQAEKINTKPVQPKKEGQNIIKVVVLAVLVVAVSVAAWFSLSYVMKQGSMVSFEDELRFLIYVVVSLSVLGAVLVTGFMLIRSKLVLFLVSLFSGLTPLLFFHVFPYILIVPLLLILGFFIYGNRVQYEVKTRIRFSTVLTAHSGLKLLIFFCIIAVTITYYLTVNAFYQEESGKILTTIIESSVDATNKVLPLKFAGYNPDKTLDEFLVENMSKLTAELSKQMSGGEEGVGNETASQEQVDQMLKEIRGAIERGEVKEEELPQEVRQALNGASFDPEQIQEQIYSGMIKQQVTKSREEMAKQLGIEVNGGEKMSEVVSAIIRKYTMQFLGPYQQYITPIMALSLLLVLWVLSPIFRLLIMFLSLILISLLKLFKFVKVVKETREVDVVKL